MMFPNSSILLYPICSLETDIITELLVLQHIPFQKEAKFRTFGEKHFQSCKLKFYGTNNSRIFFGLAPTSMGNALKLTVCSEPRWFSLPQ